MATNFDGNFYPESEAKSNDDARLGSDKPLPTSQSNRACTNCVRAKAKCSANGGFRGKCERCFRMGKLCQPSPPVRKRRTANRVSENKTSKLEEKLDGIVKLLNSTGRIPLDASDTLPKDSPVEVSLPFSHAIASGTQSLQDNAYPRPLPIGKGMSESSYTPATSASSAASPPVFLQPVLHQNLEPSPEEAEAHLNRFRSDFVNTFPFLVIPLSVTAHQLRQECPLLWVCIMTVASNDTAQQIRYSKEVRAIFGREVFVEGTRSMDLLLAILVYAVWDRYHCPEKPLLTSLMQTAIAIIYDLGLDKPPPSDPAIQLAYDLKGVAKPSRLTRSQTMEERRTLLGSFLISSIIYSFRRKGESLRWTSYSEECLRILDREKEYPSDALLVQLVKLRLISEKIDDAPWKCSISEIFKDTRPPEMFYLHSLETQLQGFKSNIPSHLEENKILRMEVLIAEIKIYEIGLTQAQETFHGQYNRRLECLWACLNATKSWIDLFFTIPPAQYFGFSLLTYTHLGICFVNLYQLLTFEHAEWDRTLVREQLDLPFILEQGEKNFSEVKKAAGLKNDGSEDTDVFTLMASRMRFAKTSIVASIAPTVNLQSTVPCEGMSDFPMDMFDEEWLRDFMIPGTANGIAMMQ